MFPNITKCQKRNMLGSPKRKKQHKLSPKHNEQIKRYRSSREKDRKRKSDSLKK